MALTVDDLRAGDELVDTSGDVLSLHEVVEVHDNGDVTVHAYRSATYWDEYRESADDIEYALGEIYVPLDDYDTLTRGELLSPGTVDADGHETTTDGGHGITEDGDGDTLTVDGLQYGDELYDEQEDTVIRVEEITDDELTWVAMAKRGHGYEPLNDTRETFAHEDINRAFDEGWLGRHQVERIPLSEETLEILDGEQRRADVAALAEAVGESSAAQGVDWWATEYVGLSAAEWARMTGRDRSTISRNAKRADGRYD